MRKKFYEGVVDFENAFLPQTPYTLNGTALNYAIKCIDTYVSSSGKICLMEEQTVSSYISCFHTFVITFKVETAHEGTKMFSVDDHDRQIS